MFDPTVGSFVGSANAKLDDDLLKHSQHQKDVLNINNKLPSDSQIDKIDFKLVKISCKKEYEPPRKVDERGRLLYEFLRLKWTWRAGLVLMAVLVVSVTVYVLIERKFSSSDTRRLDPAEFSFYMRYQANNNSKVRIRNIGFSSKSLHYETEWNGESIPSCYDLDPYTFFDSNNDGYGDLNGVGMRLGHIQNVLKMGCVLIRRVNGYFDSDTNEFTISGLDEIDRKLGNITELEKLVGLAHKRSMKILLEIDLSGTSYRHVWYDKHKEFYSNTSQTDIKTFNIDNQILQGKLIEIIKFWCKFNADGVYLRGVNNMEHQNSTSFQAFLLKLTQTCRHHSKPSAKMIADYSNKEFNQLFDLLRVRLDIGHLYASIKQSVNPFEVYLAQKKPLMWSLENLNHTVIKSQYLRCAYFVLYALGGIAMVKQGDELEYDRIQPDYPRIFRWNDMRHYSEFSNSSDNLWWIQHFSDRYKSNASSGSLVYDSGMDVKTATSRPRSILNFLIYLNQRIKPKLSDEEMPRSELGLNLEQWRQHKSRLPQYMYPRPPGDPYAKSIHSSSLIDMDSGLYNITIANSILRIQRKIRNLKQSAFYSIRIYRNAVFIVNLSSLNMPLDRLIGHQSASYNIIQSGSPIHVLYDSSHSLPDYIQFLSHTSQVYFESKANSFLALEF